jgi:hypothetical protein
LNTKLILQVAVTSLVLIAGSGLLFTGIGIDDTCSGPSVVIVIGLGSL